MEITFLSRTPKKSSVLHGVWGFCLRMFVVLLFATPCVLLGESVTLERKTAAYSVENPSALQGYFNPGSIVEVEEHVKTVGMYRVRFKLPNGQEVVALCKPDDLGKKTSAGGAAASGGGGEFGQAGVEGFEKILQSGAKSVRTDTGSWQFTRPGVESAPGKGINGSTAMMFDPGQEENWNPCSFQRTLPGLEIQELGFWVKYANSEKGFTIDFFVRSKGAREAENSAEARFRIKNSTLGGQTYPAVTPNPDASGWTYVSVILNHAKGVMKVGTSSTRIVKDENYVAFGPDVWDLPTDYLFIGTLNFAKGNIKDKLPVYFDDFSCKTAP